MPAARTIIPLTLIGVIALVAGGAIFVVRYRQPALDYSAQEAWRRVRHTYENELPQTARIESLRVLAQLDEVAAPYLAAALLSPRGELARDAELVLDERLGAWAQLPAESAASKIASLSSSLAEALETEPPAETASSGRDSIERDWRLRRLAQRLADWPVRPASPTAARWLSACERIAVRLPAPPLEIARQSIPSPPLPAVPALRDLPKLGPDTLPPLSDATPPLPLEFPTPALAPEGPTDSDPRPQTPRGFIPPLAQPITPEAAPPISDPRDDSPLSDVVTPAALSLDWFQQRTDVEVMRLLHHSEQDIRLNATTELRRRGFAPVHLALALRLTNPDPAVRREFAEALPGMAGIDSRPWLRELAGDRDESVRSIAGGILAAASARPLQR
jgi:hypothetical protein